MTTTEMIAALRPLLAESKVKTSATVAGGQRHGFIDGARVSIQRALNQLILHRANNEGFAGEDAIEPPAPAAITVLPPVPGSTTGAPIAAGK